jgi:hypothetical protein
MKSSKAKLRLWKELLGNNVVMLPGDRPPSLSDALTKREDEPKAVPPAQTLPALPQYGNFAKKVLLLTAHESADFPLKTEKSFLDKFLPAIQYTWADVKLINALPLLDQPDLFQALLEMEAYEVLISFVPRDSKALDAMDLPAYLAKKRSGRWHIIADPIESLEMDPEKMLKRKLWEAVKGLMTEMT